MEAVLFAGEDSELMNLGELTVAGELILAETTLFADTNLPIRIVADGCVTGTDHVTGGPEKEETEELTADSFAALAAAGFAEEKDYVLTESAQIAENTICDFRAGTLTVAEGVTLVNKGLLLVEGGELIVEGTLENDFFLLVQGMGNLTVKGDYAPSETSAVSWNQAAGNAILSGVAPELVDCTVVANDPRTFSQMLKPTGYRTLMIFVPDESYVADVKIPEGIAVSVQ